MVSTATSGDVSARRTTQGSQGRADTVPADLPRAQAGVRVSTHGPGRRRPFARTIGSALVVAAALSACATGVDDGGGATSSPSVSGSTSVSTSASPGTSPTPSAFALPTPSVSGSAPPPAGSTWTTVVPAERLATGLLTPDDLAGRWTAWSGFTQWPGGKPGPVPPDQARVLPAIELCPRAGSAARSAAASLQWQAYTHLESALPSAQSALIALQQSLTSGPADRVAETLAELRAGTTACVGQQVTYQGGAVGRISAVALPAVGDARFGSREVITEAETRSVWDLRTIVVRIGATIMLVHLSEVLTGTAPQPTLTDTDVATIISGAAAKVAAVQPSP